MTRKAIQLALLIVAIPAAASAADKLGKELSKREMNVATPGGQTTVLKFKKKGVVVAMFGGKSTEGRWAVEDQQLCFTWSGNFRECWPYEARFKRGQPRTIVSNRGNRVVVTLR